MADEMHEVRLGDLVDHRALLISDGYRVRNEELGPEGIPFVRGGDIGNGWINTTTNDHIRPEFVDRVRAKLAGPEDVAFITKGTVGRAGRLRVGQPHVVFAPQVAYWRVLNKDVLDPGFIFYLIRSREFRAALDGVKTHGSMVADYVSISQQYDFRFRLPAIQSQRAIGRILGALDDKIELNRRMNETLEAIAQAIFKAWFVDFDPVRAKAGGYDPRLPKQIADLFPDRFDDSELGEVPEGWRVGNIGNLASLSRDGINPSEFSDETFDHFSIPAFDEGRLPKAESGATIKSNKFAISSTCVLISKLNPRIPRIWLPNTRDSRRAVCSTEFLVLLPEPSISRELLFCLVSADEFGREFATLVTGTSGSHQRVKPEGLLNMEVVIPPKPLIEQFTGIAKSLLELASRNIEQSRTLAALRDTLLPKLLSGELRVRKAERISGSAGS
ncbi:MAG: restriction endonuclease subunit S [Burkholderiales bacterium]|nr:restriction endonuclease subunit S [Burkholderiales bacterium]